MLSLPDTLLPDTVTMVRPVLAIVLLVHVPMALAHLGPPLAPRFRVAASALAVVALCLPAGRIAGACALPWLAYSLVVAGRAMREVAFSDVPRLVLTAAAAYLAVGAGWLVLAAAGATPLGFHEPIVTLTAVHFHVAGFVGLVAVATLARRLGDAVTKAGALAAVLGMPLVALGITGSKSLEVAGVVVFTVSLLLVAFRGLVAARTAFGPGAGLGRLALACLAAAMVLALWYGVGPSLGVAAPTVPWMAATHGLLNAFGFAWPALWALRER